MNYPYAEQRKAPMAWSKTRAHGFEVKGIRNAWGDKQLLGMASDKGNYQATGAINRFKWLDVFRQDDARYQFFIETARQGTPFRNQKRLYRIS